MWHEGLPQIDNSHTRYGCGRCMQQIMRFKYEIDIIAKLDAPTRWERQKSEAKTNENLKKMKKKQTLYLALQ